jgi:beta-phosphoglucomutase-like phosphatase (HAD superfamily)
MSYRPLADAFTEQAPLFDVVVTGDAVSHGKPHPEPYLTAAARLGVDVTRCLAIEDSPSGVGSALAAGARTVGVQRLVAVAPRPGLSRVLSLHDLDDAAISRVMEGGLIDTVGEAVPAH